MGQGSGLLCSGWASGAANPDLAGRARGGRRDRRRKSVGFGVKKTMGNFRNLRSEIVNNNQVNMMSCIFSLICFLENGEDSCEVIKQ